ncbi:MAG: TonB-dependent receptor [Bacteroidota bacterium]
MKKVGKTGLLLALSIFVSIAALAQEPLRGTIVDRDTKEGLPGATVRLSGTNLGASADAEGNWSLAMPDAEEFVLIFQMVGYATLERTFTKGEWDGPIQVGLSSSLRQLEEVIVQATRASENTPTAFTFVTEKDIDEQNLGQDLPFLLNMEPSTVITSDAGAGVGYTGIRIRGTDATRINVTINGIPVNDAESQGVFWVNMPDLASSVESIQIQRGVGTSTNGSGAFGGSVNLQTSTLNPESYARLDNTVGSFNTRKHTVRVGTGLMQDHWSFDARLSQINSDGFIDRAFSDLRSWYASGGYHGEKTLVKAVAFSGREQTYQAWYGVSQAQLEDGNRTFNEAGTDFGARAEPYDNETDNYSQTYLQLIWAQEIGENWHLNNAFHWTIGGGFFEQYKVNDFLPTYGIYPLSGTDTVTNSDLIRRLWLDNDYYGWTGSAQYLRNQQLELTIGGAFYRYEGRHFGEVVWARHAGDSEIRDIYYNNNARKDDASAYMRGLYTFRKAWNLFADLQVRRVDYTFLGFNRQLENVEQQDQLTFFNPKVGLSYNPKAGHKAYASYSIGNREPSRGDYVDTTPDSRPLPETLRNLEAGYEIRKRNWTAQANVYWMDYVNQLVLTGAINDVGANVRVNVPRSYRLGIELIGGGQIGNRNPLRIEGNITLSQNKIREYTEFVPTYDPTYTRVDSLAVATTLTNTDLAFSPSLIAGLQASYTVPKTDLTVTLLSKYVGRQYLDNTQSLDKSLDPFTNTDLRLQYDKSFARLLKGMTVTVQVNNVFNALYSPNGYTFSENYLFDNGAGGFDQTGPVAYNYFFPQAGTNFLASLGLRF